MRLSRISFLITIAIFTWSFNSNAQGLENIVVESYYQSDAADEANALSNGSISPLTVGSTTYRVYVDMAPNYKFSNIFGNSAHPLTVQTTTNFYNDPNYGVSVNPGTISVNNIKKHTAMIDSWFTTGGVCATKVGVLETEDNDGTVGNNQSILANNPGGCFGLPLHGATGRDGLIPSDAFTYVVPNTLGLGSALDPLEQTEGNTIFINNGTIAALGGVVGPTSSNLVLIGQFTTSGDFSFALNVQLVYIPTGVAENYVSSSPVGSELTHPSLTYQPNTPPTVAITFPSNNATLTIGETYNITANANDNVQVTSVEFWVDGILIGTDNTSPFSVAYTATSGSHQVYTIANDNECATATSSNVNFNVTNNLAPTVVLSAPTTAVVDEMITISAIASDSDGSVTQVAFYINGVLISTDTSSPYSILYTATGGLNQLITAIATDNVGAIGNSNVVTLNVNTNVAPSISISGNTSLIVGEQITISANATDSDGSISLVTFYFNDQQIGTDISFPYSITFSPSVGANQSAYAVATDNLGAETTSNSLVVQVVPNQAPTVSISAPSNNELFISPATIEISAEASDLDGSISFVDFYIDGNLINTLYAEPFTTDWISSPGEYAVTVIATDNLGLSSTTVSVDIVVADPTALPYRIENQIEFCSTPTFCSTISVNPAYPIDNVIGFDITLLYDETKIIPTGTLSVSSDLTNPFTVEATLSETGPGQIEITLFFNGSAPEFSEFTGFGELVCIEFERLANFLPIDNTELIAPILQESYISGVEQRGVESGTIFSELPTAYNSEILFWNDNSPMIYDQQNPGNYVITNVSGYIDGILNNNADAVNPNLNGVFAHDLTLGTEIGISRDVPNSESVQLLINAADAVLAKTLLGEGNFTPNVYQIMACDVNLDGVVSAGDISQLKQRATLAIGEFQQAWNYDNEGNSNGQPSKDWIFVDGNRINNTTSFSISSTFPADDGIGFSKARVPQVPFVLDAAIEGYTPDAEVCPQIQFETYYAILLGDVNGSFANYEADGVLRTTSEYILVDLQNAIDINGVLNVPIHVQSNDVVNSLDFALTWDNQINPYLQLQKLQNIESSCTYRNEDQTLRFSAFHPNAIGNGDLAVMQIALNDAMPTEESFTRTMGLINGKQTRVLFTEPGTSIAAWDLWPNPATESFNVLSEQECMLTITSLTGQTVVNPILITKNSSMKIDVSKLTSGIYFVSINKGGSIETKKIVITH